MNPLDHLQYGQPNAATSSSMKYWNGSKHQQHQHQHQQQQQTHSPTIINSHKNGQRNDSSFQQHRINQRKFNSFLSHKDILSENTYEDGIAKDIRELELRIESELEEPNKKLTCTEEVIVSPN